MSRLLWLATFALAAPAALAAAVIALVVVTPSSPALASLPGSAVLSATTGIYDSGYSDLASVDAQASGADARALIIRNYLHRYSSPLEPYAADIVRIGDEQGVDPNLLVAIAMQESILCKRIPPGSNNCWGYGIYGDQVVKFDSYVQGAERVAKTLKEDYLDKGLKTPEQIMARYTPPSVEIGGPWAIGIRQFLQELQ